LRKPKAGYSGRGRIPRARGSLVSSGKENKEFIARVRWCDEVLGKGDLLLDRCTIFWVQVPAVIFSGCVGVVKAKGAANSEMVEEGIENPG